MGAAAATKAFAVIPPVAVSTVLSGMVWALLPPLVGLAVLVVAVAMLGLLTTGRLEDVAVRVLDRAHPPSRAEATALAPAIALLCRQGLWPPAITVYVGDRAGAAAVRGVGRRSVVVGRGLARTAQLRQLPAEEGAAVLAHAVGVVRLGLTRSDLAIEYWTIPLELLLTVCRATTRAITWLPLTHLAWKGRFIIVGVAVVQSIADARPGGPAAVVAVFIAMTYLWPRWHRAWERRLADQGDRFVFGHGYGTALAAHLRRCRATEQTLERIHNLAGPNAQPTLAVTWDRRSGRI